MIWSGNHLRSSSGSVSAFQTLAGECAISRTNRSCQVSPTCSSSPSMFASFYLCVRLIEVAFERVEAPRPHRPVWLEPRVDLAQWMKPHTIDAPLGVHPRLDEAGVAQHTEGL